MKYWTPATKRQRRALFRRLQICTRCQRNSTQRFALCLRCRDMCAAKERLRYHAKPQTEANQ